MSILRAVSSDDLDLVKELRALGDVLLQQEKGIYLTAYEARFLGVWAISQARRQARRNKAHEKSKEEQADKVMKKPLTDHLRAPSSHHVNNVKGII